MRMHWLAIGVMVGGVAGMTVRASGQILPPTPEKTPATPEYTPPPPPPTPPVITPKTNPGAPTTAPATEEHLPTLIEKDAEGKIKPLPMPAEEAAVRALKPNEETMKKVEASLSARRDDLDRMVVQNVESLVELKKFAAEVNDKTSMDLIQTNAKKVHPFRTFTSVLDRLARDGAIDPALKAKAAKIADEYRKAQAAELTKGFEHGNTQQMVLVGFRQFLSANMTEAFASLDRQLADATAKFESLLGKMEMPADRLGIVVTRTRGLPPAGTPQADAKRLTAVKEVFYDVLQPGDREALLKAANPKLFEEKPGAPKGEAPAGSGK